MRFRLSIGRGFRPCITLVLWALCHIASAQIQLTYPLDRQVVQRNNDNTASVQIAGSYSVQLDLIEARFVSLQGGSTTDWATLQANPTNGQFMGYLTAQGGWYRIEVRGKLAGQVVGTSSLAHFGVGEVFAIFGHSNAQGSSCNGTNECQQPGGALDERVVSIPLVEDEAYQRNYLSTVDVKHLPNISYAQWTATSGAAPFHSQAWFWGRMGDKLVEKLGVPVLFYGAGFGGTMIQHAYWSMNNEYFEHGFCRWDLQMPYANFRNLMTLYVPSTGIRGVLVIHGENDRGNSQETIRTNYREFMRQVRQKLNKDQLAWVIALSSYVNARHDNVRNAQWQAVNDINSTPGEAKVYLGPDLDPAPGTTGPTAYRPDGIHYSTQGQLHYAQLWADNLTAENNAFFRNSTPYTAEAQPLATLACANATQMQLRLPDGFNTYQWNTGSTDQQTVVGNGWYGARIQRSTMSNPPARDQIRVYFPPAVAVAEGQKQPDQPTLMASAPILCNGAVTLTASAAGRYVWNTGGTGQSVQVSSAGTYSVQAKHAAYDCTSAPASVSVAAGQADLDARIVASARTAAVGDVVRLTMNVRNNGPCDVAGVQVQDRLPDNLSVVTVGPDVVNTGSVISSTLVSLLNGAEASRTFTVRVTAAGTYQNAFQITTSPVGDPDSTPNSGTGDGQDDAAQVDFRTRQSGTSVYRSPNPNQAPLPAVRGNQPTPDPNKADLSLLVTASQRTAKVGQTVSVSLTVHNTGGQTATNVQVRSVLPAGLTYLASASGMTNSGGTLTGTLPSLAAGTSTTLIYTATVGTPPANRLLPISAEIRAADQPDPDSTPGNADTRKGEDDEARTEVRVL